MANTTYNVWSPPVRESRKNSLEKSIYLNLPDVSFFIWCHDCYGVSKSVYNAMDSWLYEYGITDILHRRIHMIAFLRFLKDTGVEWDQPTSVRFGTRSLIKKLRQFVEDKEDGHDVV